MDNYIPLTSEPPVPIPFGELTTSVAENQEFYMTYLISISDPLLPNDFPETPQGAIAFHALQRVQEFFTHGFLTDSNPDAPNRYIWFATTAHLLVHMHNSIRRTHGLTPLPHAFKGLNETETQDFQTATLALLALNSFFSNRSTNRIHNDDDEPEDGDICLRCLEECKYPIKDVDLDAILKSCGQNMKAAHHTVINSKLQDLTIEMDKWVSARCTSIMDSFIDTIINNDLSSFDTDHTDNPCLIAWAAEHKAAISSAATALITQTVITNTIEPWAQESLDAAFTKANHECEEYYNNLIRTERSKAKAKAIEDANQFYLTTLNSLKSEATERAERKVAAYKSELKIKVEEHKEANRLDFIKCLPKDSSSSNPVIRTNKPKTWVDPTARPRARSRSVSRSRAPSPESDPPSLLIRRSPSRTPRASPIV